MPLSADGWFQGGYPDLLRRPRRTPPPAVAWCPFSYNAYPVPDVLASLTFQPIYVDRTRRAPSRVPRWELVAPFPVAVAPLGWLPSYPDRIPARRLPPAQQLSGADVSGSLVVVGQSLAWAPRLPAWLARRRPTFEQIAFLTPTLVIAAGVDCLDFHEEAIVNPALADAILGAPAFHDTSLSRPALTGEEVC